LDLGENVANGWGKTHHEELHNLYFSQKKNYNGQIEMMRGAENVVRTGEMRNVYNIVV
jgi:hypothetical protein